MPKAIRAHMGDVYRANFAKSFSVFLSLLSGLGDAEAFTLEAFVFISLFPF